MVPVTTANAGLAHQSGGRAPAARYSGALSNQEGTVSKKREQRLAQKRAQRQRRMQPKPDGTSKYAQKKREQARGKYRRTSPFYNGEG